MLIEIPAASGRAQAWLAAPAAEPGAQLRYPGVLLFMDAIGLRPRIQEMAQEIASWGYLVVAPHVFYREGTAAQTSAPGPLNTDEARAAFFAEAMPRIARLTTDLALDDIDAYLRFLTGRPDVRAPIGVVGYCMGARLAVRAACAHPELVRACGGFHGAGLATEGADSPHRGLGRARARFVFGHADHDPGMDPDAVARLGHALQAAGLEASNEIYPDALHGYTMSDTAVYDELATERHFASLRVLFADSLHS